MIDTLGAESRAEYFNSIFVECIAYVFHICASVCKWLNRPTFWNEILTSLNLPFNLK